MGLLKVKRTYGKKQNTRDRSSDDSYEDPFDKLLLQDNNFSDNKINGNKNIRASFNRDSSLDESKIQKLKRKKQQNAKRGANTSSHDELYELYLRDKKKMQTTKRNQLRTLKAVQISTPVKNRKSRKKKIDLHFELSPIRLNDTIKNSSAANVHLSSGFFESFQRAKELELADQQNKLEVSAVAKARLVLAKYSTLPLKNTENIFEKYVDKPSDGSLNKDVLISPAYKEPLTMPEKQMTITTRRKHSAKVDDDSKENSEVFQVAFVPTSFEIPVIEITTPDDDIISKPKFIDSHEDVVANPNKTPVVSKPPSRLKRTLKRVTNSEIESKDDNKNLNRRRLRSTALVPEHLISLEPLQNTIVVPETADVISKRTRNAKSVIRTSNAKKSTRKSAKSRTVASIETCDKLDDKIAETATINGPDPQLSCNKKSVGINLVPSVHHISIHQHDEPTTVITRKSAIRATHKSVGFTIADEAAAPECTTGIALHAGKWRKSLAAWRRSHKIDQTNRHSMRRMSIKIPKRITSEVVQQQTLSFEETLGNSALWEQSDEGNLQTALSILDESIGAAFHEPLRKTSQRKTTVLERSSIFYGLEPSAVIDVDILPNLSSRQIVLRRCGQQEPLLFDDIYSESQLPNCCKIGEGVYGEVFMNKSQQLGQPIVLKIIPIEGDQLINGEHQKKFSEILSEIVIAMELSSLRNGKEHSTNGFVNVKRVSCVQGAYPQHLIDLWELYRDNYGTENDNPEVFGDDQLYIVFELCNAGRDLEAFTFDNAEQSYSAFLQTALTLAVAERQFEFEHRDLHWGNILVARTDDKFAEFRLDGRLIKVPTHGIKATIIDFTLSRMLYDGCVLYNDLANDEELFEATGDYQFDIYRLMKARVRNHFEVFEPFTNLLWLHYIIDKLINGARYRLTKTKKHRSNIHAMMQLRDELLDYKSATNYVQCL